MTLPQEIEEAKQRLLEYYDNPSREIARFREEKGRVFGYLCSHVPEEILFAADILPIRIFGHLDDLTASLSHFQPFVCRLLKSVLDSGLTGRLDYLDGLIISYTCDGMRMLYDAWCSAIQKGFTYLLDLPSSLDRDPNQKYFEKVQKGFVSKIEELTEAPLDPQRLREAIRTYNHYRTLARRFYALRSKSDLPLSSSEVLKINLGATLAPKDRFSENLLRLIELLEKWVDKKPRPSSSEKARIHVSGSLVVDPVFYDIIDRTGGMVVSDDLCVGTRYYWDLVKETADPFLGLRDRYLNKVTCPSKYPSLNRSDFILARIRESGARGVIIIGEKYCDPHLFDLPVIREKIEDLGVTTLWLETELAASGEEQLVTRLESFMDILK